MALCLHPYATWRTKSRSRKAFVLLAYAAASYAVVLGAMMAL